MICNRYHPADEPCDHKPEFHNGEPMVIHAGGIKVPVMTDDVDGGKISIDLSGCCDPVKGRALAHGYQMVVE